MEFILRLKKTTKCKACFKENMDRIGRIYLPIPLLEKMNIGGEIILQLAPDKSYFSPGGYAAKFVQDKETAKKVRYTEDIIEQGEMGFIYVNKNVLERLGVGQEIAVRIVAPREYGGAIIAKG
ncbi:hypothetical protein [Desulfofarcimen acetoxidans]|nr:hypothetical protein [Desulfofarcimen acetoxidans]